MKDITNDKELVEVIDELMHRLKPLETGLGILFKAHMNDFIQTYKLDGDPHAFASLPEKWPQ